MGIHDEVDQILARHSIDEDEIDENAVFALTKQGENSIDEFIDYYEKTWDEESPITGKEAGLITYNFAKKRGDDGFTSAELQQVLSWAIEVRVGSTVLDLVCEQKVAVDLQDDSDEPVFSLTPEGENEVGS